MRQRDWFSADAPNQPVTLALGCWRVLKRKIMRVKIIYFLSLLFVALALVPAMAHLLELPNKIGLSREEYLIVQQIYRGWALLGFVVYGALLSTLVLTITVRQERKAFLLALLGFLCIVATQVVFWTYTYPANQATDNWTMLPENWAVLRRQWEYSHATSAAFNLFAMVAVILSVLAKVEDRSMGSELIDPQRDEQVWPNMALAGGPSASRPAAEGRR